LETQGRIFYLRPRNAGNGLFCLAKLPTASKLLKLITFDVFASYCI